VSITYLSDAGNLFDIAVLSLIAALKDVKLPNTIIVGTDVCVETGDIILYYIFIYT
jgi:exosome complex RNA-binding protein Rrp42 (RNase PH superfamily)